MNDTNETVDITPSPRVLRILGDIPFSTHQCIAELLDNSLDAFRKAELNGIQIDAPQISVAWSSANVAAHEREISFKDNGVGMSLETLQRAAKAGYSSNDSIHNLGLFGMGFNISTARLGDETVFLSTTKGDSEWVGIRISFEELIKSRSFSAPIVRMKKENANDSGTMIIVRNLKEGVFSELQRKVNVIRNRLSVMYSAILENRAVSVFLNGKQLAARSHCVWGAYRYVVRSGKKVPAIIAIDRDLGESYFDEERNRYLTDDEFCALSDDRRKAVVMRSRRLRGWLGIQRYSDPSDFGIDLVRNGRKIVIADKSLFAYENPDTGTMISEYPIELGSTVGGRIVGELHVDYLIPNYQKSDFDRSDIAWRLTVEAIRGAGPILPQKRKMLGYDEANESPLGMLVNAYRRLDPGTRNLFVQNSISKTFYEKFRAGELEYEDDSKWYKAAQEADRAHGERTGRQAPAYKGDKPSDNLDAYAPVVVDVDAGVGAVASSVAVTAKSSQCDKSQNNVPLIISSTRDELIRSSEKMETMSGQYFYDPHRSGMKVSAWKIRKGVIRQNGDRKPYVLFKDGVDVDFFYDSTHPAIAEYPISEKQFLLLALAEKFSVRDMDVSYQNICLGLLTNHLEEERINVSALKERAHKIFQTIKENLPETLQRSFAKVKGILHEVESEEESFLQNLLNEAPELWTQYKANEPNAYQTLSYVPFVSIPRIIACLPEDFLDDKVFLQPYDSLNDDISSPQMLERLKRNSVDKIIRYLCDALALLDISKSVSKQELIRYSNTLTLLERLLK